MSKCLLSAGPHPFHAAAHASVASATARGSRPIPISSSIPAHISPSVPLTTNTTQTLTRNAKTCVVRTLSRAPGPAHHVKTGVPLHGHFHRVSNPLLMHLPKTEAPSCASLDLPEISKACCAAHGSPDASIKHVTSLSFHALIPLTLPPKWSASRRSESSTDKYAPQTSHTRSF